MTAQYRILSPANAKREDGQADVEVKDGALMLAPSGESVLRIPFWQISSVTEPEPFTIRLTLAGGDAIELSRLGVMRTQLLAELRDARAQDAAHAAAAVGEAAIFDAVSGGDPAEVRVYEDALLISGAVRRQRVSFSFVAGVQVRDYVVTVEVAGAEPVILTRLGHRTGELVGLLAERLREARVRTAAFLASLLPGLDPMTLRQAAGLLRDGVAVPRTTLDGLHPALAGTLLRVATLPARRDTVAELDRRTDLAIGFRQLVTVRRPAVGVTPWHDHAATPHIGEHESPGGSFRPGPMGMMAAGVMTGGFGFGEGYGAFGDYWAFRALGAGMNASGSRPMAARPDLTRGRLTPAIEDLSALAVTGENPTVLAFALGVVPAPPGLVVYEVLNQLEPMTFVYRASELAPVNRALDDAGFRAAALDPPPIGQVPHDAQWSHRLTAFISPERA